MSTLSLPPRAGFAADERSPLATPRGTTTKEEPSATTLYDRLVDRSPQGSIYCRAWWLDAVAPGRWELLTVRRGGDLAAAWPLVYSDDRRRRIGMPKLTQKLGILIDPTDAKPAETLSREHELVEELAAQLPPKVAIRQNFHEHFTNWLPLHWCGFQTALRCTYVLPDLDDLDKLWETMRSPCRRAVRKATREGLKVRDDLSLDRFLELHALTWDRQGLTCPIPQKLLRRVDKHCSHRGRRRLLAASDPAGRVHSAIYIVHDAGTSYYLMSGSDPELRHSGAFKLLLWESIRDAASRSRRFDFEGSMLRPIERVFREFGGRQVSYPVLIRERRRPGRVVRRALGFFTRR